MDPVNKEQAEKCRDIGAEALRKGDYDRAVKFLSKSIQLHALPGVSSLLSQAEQKRSSVHDAASSSQSQSQSQPQSESQAPRYNRSASSSTSIGADGRSYDESQVALIRKILHAKASGGRQAHYQVLGIPPQADASAIKKAYRKLALQLHPDKNSAPGAEDAFKAIGLAYATLSDEQKRTIYDRYGDEDPDNHGASGGGGGFRRHGGGGVHFQGQEVNPEDIFNAFFGGGMPGGMHMNMGGMPGGFRVYTTGFGGGRGGGFHTRTNPGGGGRPGQQEAPANTAAGLMQLLFQFLPVLLLFAMSFFQFPGEHHTSGHAGGNNYFRLTHSPPYIHPLKTKVTQVKEIPFFVTDTFLRTYARDKYQLSQVERMVEKSYKQYLMEECKNQQLYKASLEKLASSPNSSRNVMSDVDRERQMKRAKEFELSRCIELESLFHVMPS